MPRISSYQHINRQTSSRARAVAAAADFSLYSSFVFLFTLLLLLFFSFSFSSLNSINLRPAKAGNTCFRLLSTPEYQRSENALSERNHSTFEVPFEGSCALFQRRILYQKFPLARKGKNGFFDCRARGKVWARLYQSLGETWAKCGRDFTKVWARLRQSLGETLPKSGRDFTKVWARLRQSLGKAANQRARLKHRARSAPLTLCQTLKIAPGTAAIG